MKKILFVLFLILISKQAFAETYSKDQDGNLVIEKTEIEKISLDNLKVRLDMKNNEIIILGNEMERLKTEKNLLEERIKAAK